MKSLGWTCATIAVAAAWIIIPASMAAQVRSATEQEIADALIGCWDKEPTRDVLYFETIGIFNKSTLCFEPSNLARMSWVGGDAMEIEAGADEGTFRLEGEKLLFSDIGEGLFGRDEASCDVVMSADYSAMRFENCVGTGPYANGEHRDPEIFPHISFARVAR